MRAYTEEKDFIADSLVTVARLFFDRAVLTISDGNIDDAVEQALRELVYIAQAESMDKAVINAISVYLETVADENRQMRIDFGWD